LPSDTALSSGRCPNTNLDAHGGAFVGYSWYFFVVCDLKGLPEGVGNA
jgi:hypothetical protein